MDSITTVNPTSCLYKNYDYQPKNTASTFDSINKLYSSLRLPHNDLPSTSIQKSEISVSEVVTNLTSSLDGLFSKIEAIKEEHTAEQQNSKCIIRKKIDVSGFPIPNLSNTFLKKFPIETTSPKQILKEKSNELEKFSEKNKSMSPPSESIYYESENSLKSPKNYFSNYKNDFSSFSTNESRKSENSPKRKFIDEDYEGKSIFIKQCQNGESSNFEFQKIKLSPTVFYPCNISVKSVKNLKQEHEKSDFLLTKFSKSSTSTPNYLATGLLNVPNLKVSTKIKDNSFEQILDEPNRSLKIDQVISEEMNTGSLIQKEIAFNQVSLRDFELGKLVGSGKFGDVHICRHKATKTLFALKKIFKSSIIEYNMINQFTRELKIHYTLNHPHVIKLYTHFDDEYHIFLLMEYAEGGILMDKLKCAEDMASRYVEQTISAVQYLHKLKIAHRDIKPENIVLQFGNFVKLCDFGWSSYYEDKMKTTFCGTLDYLSPEMKEGGQYDNSVDIWSIGILTYELLTGSPPYRKELMLSMKNGICNKAGNRKINWEVNYPTELSPMSESFIRNLLKENPSDRASLRFCLNHIFIKKYKKYDEDCQFSKQLSQII